MMVVGVIQMRLINHALFHMHASVLLILITLSNSSKFFISIHLERMRIIRRAVGNSIGVEPNKNLVIA
jgi:hypothetical protein